jgi:hypothetical protein
MKNELIELDVFYVTKDPTIYINGHRICGLNPVGQKATISTKVRKKDLIKALNLTVNDIDPWIDVRKGLPEVPKPMYGKSVLAIEYDPCWVSHMGNKPDVHEDSYMRKTGFDMTSAEGPEGRCRIDRIDPVILWKYMPPAPTPKEIHELLGIKDEPGKDYRNS